MVAASSNAAAARHRVWAMVGSNPTRSSRAASRSSPSTKAISWRGPSGRDDADGTRQAHVPDQGVDRSGALQRAPGNRPERSAGNSLRADRAFGRLGTQPYSRARPRRRCGSAWRMVTHRYGKATVPDGVTLALSAGRAVGLIGPASHDSIRKLWGAAGLPPAANRRRTGHGDNRTCTCRVYAASPRAGRECRSARLHSGRRPYLMARPSNSGGRLRRWKRITAVVGRRQWTSNSRCSPIAARLGNAKS
jgi:hypothetical protein